MACVYFVVGVWMKRFNTLALLCLFGSPLFSQERPVVIRYTYVSFIQGETNTVVQQTLALPTSNDVNNAKQEELAINLYGRDKLTVLDLGPRPVSNGEDRNRIVYLRKSSEARVRLTPVDTTPRVVGAGAHSTVSTHWSGLTIVRRSDSSDLQYIPQ